MSRHNKRSTVDNLPYTVGITVSFIAHCILAVIAMLVLEKSRASAGELVEVLSVTLEGGEKLGGINQVPFSMNAKVPKVSPTSIQKQQSEEKYVKKHDGDKDTETSKDSLKAREVEEPATPKTPTEHRDVLDKDLKIDKLPETLPEAKKTEIDEAAMLEERLLAEKEKKEKEEKKKLEQDRKEKEDKERRLKEEKELEEKKKDEEKRKLIKQKEEEEEEKKLKELENEKKRKEKGKKEREDLFRKAIKSAQQRSDMEDTSGESPGRSDYNGESANAGGQGWGAAALGGKGMGGGSVRPLEFVVYVNQLEQHIKGGWRWIKGGERFVSVVSMRLAPSGVVQSASVQRSSGNTQFDESALRAVYKASPVPPPPDNLYEQFREARITFDSQE